MALIHDTCEIDAGDCPIYGQDRPDQHEAELRCIQRLEAHGVAFGHSMLQLWLEYEEQISIESRWVKVLDRLMPFIVNIASGGKNWKEQSISRSQLLRVNEPVLRHAPELYEWMLQQIEGFVAAGWLRDA